MKKKFFVIWGLWMIRIFSRPTFINNCKNQSTPYGMVGWVMWDMYLYINTSKNIRASGKK